LYVAVDGTPDSPRSVHPAGGAIVETTAIEANENATLPALPLTAGIVTDFDAGFSDTADAPTGFVGETPAYVAVVQAVDCDEDSLKVSVPAGVAVVTTFLKIHCRMVVALSSIRTSVQPAGGVIVGLPRELNPSTVTCPAVCAGRSTAMLVPVAAPDRESTNDTVLGGGGAGVLTVVALLGGDDWPAVSCATTV
jgi:hypothetical protein